MGKCLGGTSSLNYMVHMRGSPKDYDKWSFESGCINCDYQSLLPYFIMTESVDSGMTARPGIIGISHKRFKGMTGM